jgi:hypothetical protein
VFREILLFYDRVSLMLHIFDAAVLLRFRNRNSLCL